MDYSSLMGGGSGGGGSGTVASSAEAQSGNTIGGFTPPGGFNPLEVIVIAVVGIIFSLIIVSAFRK